MPSIAAPALELDLAAPRRVLARAVELANDRTSQSEKGPSVPHEAFRALALAEVRAGLDAVLVGRNPEPGLDLLQSAGLFAALLPEVEAMVGMGDSEFRHKDVWKHTKLVVRQSVPRLVIRWGALLHDIGKPKTRRIEPDGGVSFHGHAELGASMFRRKVRGRMGFDGELGDRIHFLILHHLRASQYDPDWTDSAVRRFYKQMGEGLRDLLDLSRADITTKRPEKKRRGVRQIAELSRRVRMLAAEDERVPPLPKGLGTILSQEFGVPPSKRLGDLMKALEAAAEEGTIERARDAAYYCEQIRADLARYGLG